MKCIHFILISLIFTFVNAWTYNNHGTDWNQNVCLTSTVQSPIALSVAGLSSYNMKAKLSLNYRDLENVYLYRSTNRYQMYINVTSHDGNVTYVDEFGNETFYGLENIFFRYKSEHILEGTQYTMEMQLVHRNPADETQTAIVSVLFDASQDLNNDFMLELDPRTTNINQPRKKISFASQLFDNFYGNFFHYNGSMTFPPCSENVRWFVFSVPV